ncbi:MAG: CPBP family intramembrane metalloprotease [Acidobacteriota bacterium]|nr:CPBP family intramembrane metalloprotease [Acidobacteriota bacterium]
MSIPDERGPLVGPPANIQAGFGPKSEPAFPPAAVIDPNNPPWGIAAGILTWVASVVLLLGMGILFGFTYAAAYFKGGSKEELIQFLTTDKTALFFQILSALPAHLLTFVIVWAVVTHFGKRPFWESIGWDWGRGFGFWKSAGLAVGLLLLGMGITRIVGGGETSIDQISHSSAASRYTLAILAGVTAPLIEELVYRGILYSALQKVAGIIWAVIAVSALFALVHVAEYYNNVGVIAVISLLSVCLTMLRAYTGRLLPCFIVHLVFNGIQAVIILIEPYLQSAPEQKAPALSIFWRAVLHLF